MWSGRTMARERHLENHVPNLSSGFEILDMSFVNRSDKVENVRWISDW